MAHWASTTNWMSGSGHHTWSDPNLVRAAKAGDKRAFQQLIARYDRLVLTFVLNVTQSERDARDIYERVFMLAFRTISAKEVESSMFVWIYRIAVECCQSFLLDESERQRQGGCQRLTEAVRDRFSMLSVRERLVFVMAQYARLRAITIAEILNSTETSVKEALVRAVYKLDCSKQDAA